MNSKDAAAVALGTLYATLGEIRDQGLRYMKDADEVARGDYTDEQKAFSAAALHGYSLCYSHMLEIYENMSENFEASLAKVLGEDDRAFPGLYL